MAKKGKVMCNLIKYIAKKGNVICNFNKLINYFAK